MAEWGWVGYIVVWVVVSGVLHGLHGWGEPWIILAMFWPVALPMMAIYQLTRHVKQSRQERQHRIKQERIEQDRLLREAGIEP